MIIKYKDLIGDAWTLLSTTVIQTITPISGLVLDGVPFAILTLIDFEGGLYATWKDTQGRFICIKNNDDDEYFLIGRITDIVFDNDTTIISMVGGLDELTDNEAYSINYILAQGLVGSVDSQTELTLTDDEGVAFVWAANQWVNNRDVAAILTDATVASTQVWHEEDANPTHAGWDDTNLNGAKCLLPNNGLFDHGIKNGDPENNYFDYELGGVDIPNGEEIEKINIKCRIGGKPDSSDDEAHERAGFNFQLYFWNYNTSAWDKANTFLRVLPYNQADEAPVDVWSTVAMQNDGDDITTNPSYYLHDTGANFDYIKVRILVDFETGNWTKAEVYVDFLEAEVFYQTAAFSPYQKKITANGASDITSAGATFQDKGISVGDQFQIGENTLKILTDTLQLENMSYSIDPNLDKYMARHFKGRTRKVILNAVSDLEGAYKTEYYIGDISNISFYRSANFPSPAATFKGHTDTPLTEADYDTFKLRRPDNAYEGVKVYGNAFNGIEATAGAIEGRIKKIINDSIKTEPDAQEVADTQYAILGTLRPSYEIILFGDSYDHLKAGMNVYVTFARPTIVKTEYPIRSIKRSQGLNGKLGIMNTVVELGLGATTIEEKLGKYIANSIEQSDLVASNYLLPGSSSGVPTISHTNLSNKTANDHHTKYTDAEAAAKIALDDLYVKILGDILLGDLTIAKASPTMTLDASSGEAVYIAEGASGQDSGLIMREVDTTKASILYDAGENELVIETSGAENIILKVNGNEEADINADGLQLGAAGARAATINTNFVDNDTSLMTSQAIKEKIAADALTNPITIDVTILKAAPLMILDGTDDSFFIADSGAGDDSGLILKENGASKGIFNYDAGANKVFIENYNNEAIQFKINSVEEAELTSAGLQLGGSGGTIQTFDTAALAASDTKVPTNTTVKEYVDNQSHGFTWLANIANVDFLKTDLTNDVNLNDLDLSGIVGAVESEVILRVYGLDNALSWMEFRTKGGGTTYDRTTFRMQVVNQGHEIEFIGHTDSDGKMQFQSIAKPGDWTTIWIIVKGYRAI